MNYNTRAQENDFQKKSYGQPCPMEEFLCRTLRRFARRSKTSGKINDCRVFRKDKLQVIHINWFFKGCGEYRQPLRWHWNLDMFFLRLKAETVNFWMTCWGNGWECAGLRSGTHWEKLRLTAPFRNETSFFYSNPLLRQSACVFIICKLYAKKCWRCVGDKRTFAYN